jgi:hypothetical protein
MWPLVIGHLGNSWRTSFRLRPSSARTCQSAALGSLHEVMQDLHDVGAIDKATMRDFDLGCLTEDDDLRS